MTENIGNGMRRLWNQDLRNIVAAIRDERSRNLFLSTRRLKHLSLRELIHLRDSTIMGKLSNRKVRWILRELGNGELSVREIARHQGITQRWVRGLRTKYKGVPIDMVQLKRRGRKKEVTAAESAPQEKPKARKTVKKATKPAKQSSTKRKKKGE